jgi:DNA helicase-4
MTKSMALGFKSCLNPACNNTVPLCEKCGAEMVLRTSHNGDFWGCRNYRGNDELSCKNSIAQSRIKWPELSA